MRHLRLVVACLLVIFAGTRHVQAQTIKGATPQTKSATPQPLQGDVTSIGPDSFVIKDKNNPAVTVKVGPKTTYQLDKNKSTFADAVRLKYTIRATMGAGGVATDVTSNSNQPAPPPPSLIDQLHKALQVTDDEWLILRPRIEKVQALQTKLDNLEKTVTIKNLPPVKGTNDQIKADLAAKRDARAKLSADLAQARKDLISILTLPQEMQLFQLGIVK